MVRESDDKQNTSNNGSSLAPTTRRRNRANNNLNRKHTNISKVSNGPIIKGKGRQSVSTDSGVMSDESQSSSPTSLLNNNMPQQLNMAMNSVVDAARHSLMLQRPTITASSNFSTNTANSDALAAFAKSKLLGNLLANQFPNNLLEPATSTQNFPGALNQLPLAGKLATLSHFLGNNGLIPTENSLNDLLLNLSSPISNLVNNTELERLQMLQLYNYQKQQQQQNILQQILLGSSNLPVNNNAGLNSEQLLLTQFLQEYPLNDQNNSLLAQLLLSKLTPTTTEQKKFNDYLIQQQQVLSSTSQENSTQQQQKPSNARFLEEYVLKDGTTKMEVDSCESKNESKSPSLRKTESDSSMLVV